MLSYHFELGWLIFLFLKKNGQLPGNLKCLSTSNPLGCSTADPRIGFPGYGPLSGCEYNMLQPETVSTIIPQIRRELGHAKTRKPGSSTLLHSVLTRNSRMLLRQNHPA